MAASTVEIIKGTDRSLTLKIISKSTQDPYDLTGVDAVSISFPGDPSTVTKTLGSGMTIVNALAGKLTVDLSDTDTSGLKTGEKQDFEVTLDAGTDRKIVQFKKAITILDKLL